jgi:hypothetical protein
MAEARMIRLSTEQKDALTEICREIGISPERETEALSWCEMMYSEGQERRYEQTSKSGEPRHETQRPDGAKAFHALIEDGLLSPRTTHRQQALIGINKLLKRQFG